MVTQPRRMRCPFCGSFLSAVLAAYTEEGSNGVLEYVEAACARGHRLRLTVMRADQGDRVMPMQIPEGAKAPAL